MLLLFENKYYCLECFRKLEWDIRGFVTPGGSVVGSVIGTVVKSGLGGNSVVVVIIPGVDGNSHWIVGVVSVFIFSQLLHTKHESCAVAKEKKNSSLKSHFTIIWIQLKAPWLASAKLAKIHQKYFIARRRRKIYWSLQSATITNKSN